MRCAHWHQRVLRGHLASAHAVLRPDRGRDRRATTHPPCLSFWALLNGQTATDYKSIHPGACGDKIANHNSSRPGQECDFRSSSGNSCPRDAVFIFPLPGPEMEIACGKSESSRDFGCSSPALATTPRPPSMTTDPCAQTHSRLSIPMRRFSCITQNLRMLISRCSNLSFGDPSSHRPLSIDSAWLIIKLRIFRSSGTIPLESA